MFGDTLVLPWSGGDITLNKINQDGYSSEYLFKNSTNEYRAKIRHSKEKVASGELYDRHNVEVVQTIFAAGEVPEYHRKAYFVIVQKPDDTDVLLFDAIADWSILTSNTNLTKLLGWQS